MKYILLTLMTVTFAISMTNSQVVAQPPPAPQAPSYNPECEGTPPEVPAKTFPIGGFEISTLNGVRLDCQNTQSIPDKSRILDKMGEAGLNTMYHVNSSAFANGGWQQRLAYSMPSGMQSYYGASLQNALPIGDNPPNGIMWVGNRFGNTQGAEVRYFLASNETDEEVALDVEKDQIKKYENSQASAWKTVSGQRLTLPNDEWRILNSQGTDNEVLKLEANLDVFLDGREPGQNKAYLYFIYRIDGNSPIITDPVSGRPTDDLFEIRINGNSAAVIDYGTSISSSTGGHRNFEPLEKSSLKKFKGQDYSICRIEFELPSSGPIEIKLVRLMDADIYVRGFRIRSHMADQMLRGMMDGQISAGITALKNGYLDAGGPEGWAKVPYINHGGELTFECFRTLAYIERKFHLATGKRIISFLSNNLGFNYGWYRSIYEDQTGALPPPIIQQDFSAYSKDNNFGGRTPGAPPSMPIDGLPKSLRDMTEDGGFTDLGFGVEDHADYTTIMQTSFNKATANYANAANAAYPVGKKSGKWYSILSAIFNFRGKQPHDNTPCTSCLDDATRRANLLGTSTTPGPVRTALREGNFEQAFDYNIPWSSIWSSSQNALELDYWQGGNTDILVTERGPFKEEMRADMWMSLCYGAKGVFWNPIGSDHGENNGIGDANFLTDIDHITNDNKKGLVAYEIGSHSNPFYPSSDFTHHMIRCTSGCDDAYEFQWIPISVLAEDIGEWLSENPIKYITDDNGEPGPRKILDTELPGTWVPYLDPFYKSNEWQSIVLKNGVTGGTFRLTYDGQQTAAIPHNATCSTIVSALKALSNIEENEVACSNNDDALPNQQIWIQFTGGLSETDVPSLTADFSLLTGGSAPRGEIIQGNIGRPDRWVDFYNIDEPKKYTGIWPNHWPFERISGRAYFRAFYGYKEKWEGLKQCVADVKPIAPLLAELEWQRKPIQFRETGSGGSDAATWATYPIIAFIDGSTDKTSEKINVSTLSSGSLQSAGTFDATRDESLYQLALFTRPGEDNTHYVMISNRRSWPLDYTYTSGVKTGIDQSDSKLGAKDARKFNFHLNTSILPSTYTYYSVTNMRTGKETIGKLKDSDVGDSDEDPYSVILEPGEGTLFRIAPAYSFIAGKTSAGGMEYNNGHRIAELGTGGDPSKIQRIMTWEREGSIQYAIVNNSGEASEENFFNPASPVGAPSGTDANTLHYSSGSSNAAQHPSVCAKINTSAKDTVAVVWSQVNNGTQRQVKIKIGTRTPSTSAISITDWATFTVFSETLSETDFPTPVVTPLRDGFFVSWAGFDPLDGNKPVIKSKLYHVRTVSGNAVWQNISNQPLRANPNAAKVLFPTVASREEFSSSSSDRKKNRVHLAWEEWTATSPKIQSHIYYSWFDVKYPTGSATDVLEPSETDGSSYERVSKGHTRCRHHHPNIAVSNAWTVVAPRFPDFGQPIVTWETVSCVDNSDAPDETRVVMRSKEFDGYDSFVWGTTFNHFYLRRGNPYPQPLVRAGTLPEELGTPEPRSVVFHDQTRRTVITERQDNAGKWTRSTFYESGQNPSITLPFAPPYAPEDLQEMTTISFRGGLKDETGLYKARVTARTSGYERQEKFNMASTIMAKTNDPCGPGVAFIVGDGSVGCPTCPSWTDTTATNPRKPIEWQTKDLSREGFGLGKPRSGVPNLTGGISNGWPVTEDSIRTNNFVVNSGDNIIYNYLFMLEDSIGLGVHLPDSTRSISFEVILKDSASHSQVAILDTFRISRIGGPSIHLKLPQAAANGIDPCAAYFKSTGGGGDPAGKGPVGSIPPSGKGYLTVRALKDSLSQFEFTHANESYEAFADVVGELTELPALKPTTHSMAKAARQVLDLYVYPNPFNSLTEISLKAVADAPTTIELFDVSGRPVMTLFEGYAPSSGIVSLKLDRAGLADGTYFLRAVSGGVIGSKRIVVLK